MLIQNTENELFGGVFGVCLGKTCKDKRDKRRERRERRRELRMKRKEARAKMKEEKANAAVLDNEAKSVQVKMTDQLAQAELGQTQQAETKSNTMLYVSIGGGVLLLILVVLVIIMNKKKA